MTNNKKSLIMIKVVDLLGNPIPRLEYQVKNQNNGRVIAAGPTNSAGCIVEISRDKGTVLDVYIKNIFSGKMSKVQSFVMSQDRMLVKIISPKVLLDLATLLNQGNVGQYKRKTHIVKKGETLTSIAAQNHTTVRVLENLNRIDDPDKINIGQVIKLPVNIPANGNNSHQEKAKRVVQPKQSATPKSSTSTQSGSTPKVPHQPKTNSGSTVADYGNQALDQANNLYEEGKKAFNDAVGTVTKILTVDDRSQDGGTPKVNTTNLCKTNPQCISSGKSELIREINIRLAGFGGALPTDEFTELTAKCIKQFQRDYMGVPETGKICGSVLVALDKFLKDYPIDSYFNQMKCPCKFHGGGKQCDGFGAGRTKQYYKNGSRGNLANEYKGMHRSVVWIFKAANFYINRIDKKQFTLNSIDSGYRCIENNDAHNGSNEHRTTVNHMGLALDLHFNKNGNRTKEEADMDLIRSTLFSKLMAASTERGANKIYLEPAWYGKAKGARTWVHFDLTRYEKRFLTDNFFAKTIEKLNGDLLSNLVKAQGLDKILLCSGKMLLQPIQSAPKGTKKLFDENDAKAALRVIYDTYGKDIAIVVEKMYRGETTHFKSEQYKHGGTPGMEAHGSAPYYGWDEKLFTEAPIGTWSAYEGKGLSGVGGNAQITKSKKVFVCVSSVLVGMNYVAKYIQKHNGNYARWFSTNASKQAVYREHMGKIKARIVPSFE